MPPMPLMVRTCTTAFAFCQVRLWLIESHAVSSLGLDSGNHPDTLYDYPGIFTNGGLPLFWMAYTCMLAPHTLNSSGEETSEEL